jgi:hypothetical protein
MCQINPVINKKRYIPLRRRTTQKALSLCAKLLAEEYQTTKNSNGRILAGFSKFPHHPNFPFAYDE